MFYDIIQYSSFNLTILNYKTIDTPLGTKKNHINSDWYLAMEEKWTNLLLLVVGS